MNHDAVTLSGGAAPVRAGWDTEHFAELQPHGAVLIVDPAGAVTHVSDGAAAVIGREPAQLVGRPAADIVGEAEAERARALAGGDRRVLGGWRPGTLAGGSRVRVHTWTAGDGAAGIDVVPADAGASPDLGAAIERVAGWNEWLSRCTSSVELLEIVATIARERLVFAGAWVVRLDAGDRGEIVAWDAPSSEGAMNTLVDAADLPPATPRVDGRPEAYFVDDLQAPGQRLWPDAREIDLQRSALLRPFPEYLAAKAAAGVRSTACLPLMGENALWGRVICHAEQLQPVPSPVQAELRLLATTASSRLAELLAAEDAMTAARLAQHTVRLIGGIATGDVLEELAGRPEALLGICDADGALLRIAGAGRLAGKSLPTEVAAALLALAREDLLATGQPVVARASLPSTTGIDPRIVSGFAAARLDPDAEDVIVWHRSTEGDDGLSDDARAEAALADAPHGGLPRTNHTSRPWMPAERAQVEELRLAVVELQSARAAELRAANAELQRANAEYDAFTHAAAHDLRAPLRGIRQHAEFLAEDLEGRITAEEAAELGAIVRLSAHMRDLLDGLMDYAQVGKAALAPEHVPVDAVVADAVAFLGLELPDGAITATSEQFCADRKALMQLLQNLIGNAVKHSAGTPAITIDVTDLAAVRTLGPTPDTVSTMEGATSVLSVSDDGPGIDPADHERIFDLFRQLDTRAPGSGAGLAICRLISRRHGGDIWVRSTPGSGATFYVTVADHCD